VLAFLYSVRLIGGSFKGGGSVAFTSKVITAFIIPASLMVATINPLASIITSVTSVTLVTLVKIHQLTKPTIRAHYPEEEAVINQNSFTVTVMPTHP
jgi:glycerol-3-phosphate acyltransferase PlsY